MCTQVFLGITAGIAHHSGAVVADPLRDTDSARTAPKMSVKEKNGTNSIIILKDLFVHVFFFCLHQRNRM